MVEAIYIFILAFLIPFFKWQQREEGRNLAAILVTGLFLCGWILYGTIPFALDKTTILVLCFASYMIASMLWNHSRQGSQDLYTMICGLVVFLVARSLSVEVVVIMLFMVGFIFAAASVYYKDSKNPAEKWFILGNSNHTGNFFLIPIFAGLWLSFNTSYFWALSLPVIIYALILTKCRGAQIGLIAGLLFCACVISLWSLLLIPIGAFIGWRIIRSKGKDLYQSSSNRFSLILAAFLIIQKSPLFGYGLRTFRREYPAVIPQILNSKLLRRFYARDTLIQHATSHRIHNDHLEIIFELGLVGYAIFIAIFTTLAWTVNPLLSAGVVAIAVSGLFFFPLRECHTAFPFWALAGILVSSSGEHIIINFTVSIILALIIMRLMYGVAIKLLGLFYYDKAVKIQVMPNVEDVEGKKLLQIKQAFINKAIQCDPYNNIYLTEGYYYNVFHNPEVAFQYASRCFENFDGGKVKWGVADQYARALIRLGGFGVAKMAGRYALAICPDFQQTRDLMAQIAQLEGQAKGT
jgi:O-antigen ligase